MSVAAAPTSTTNSHIYLFDISNWGNFPLPKPSSTGATLRLTNQFGRTIIPGINGLSPFYERVDFDSTCSCVTLIEDGFLSSDDDDNDNWCWYAYGLDGGSSSCSSPSLTAIDFTSLHGVTTIKSRFLAKCTGLLSLDLTPLAGTTSIGNDFLSGCTGLAIANFTPLRNVESVGSGALCGCDAIVYVSEAHDAFIESLQSKTVRSVRSVSLDNATYVKPLGNGGEGFVDLFDSNCRGPVAVKSTPPSKTPRLRQEYDKLSRINHPNVIAVYQYTAAVSLPNHHETSTGQLHDCIIMEHAPLGSVADFVKNNKNTIVNLKQWLDMALQILRGLQVLHAHNIHHNDIKPLNIVMVLEDHKVVYKIIDLGLADDLSYGTDTSILPHCVGTRCFIAPESVERNEYSRPSDVYSWACTMGYIATGKMPKAHSKGQASTLRGFTVADFTTQGTRVPNELADMLVRCFSFVKTERPTVAQLLDAFGSFYQRM